MFQLQVESWLATEIRIRASLTLDSSESEIYEMSEINGGGLLTHFSNPLHVNDTLAGAEWSLVTGELSFFVSPKRLSHVSFLSKVSLSWPDNSSPVKIEKKVSEFTNIMIADYVRAAQSSSFPAPFITEDDEISSEFETLQCFLSCRIRCSSE